MSRTLRRPGALATTGASTLIAFGLCCTLLVTGCGAPSFSGIEDVPLPGGADLGDHPYEITADFGDVLSLAPQSSVKVNDVAVGRVTKISLAPDTWQARVTMKVNGQIKLPANAYAHLEQSSLLGEKYIQLSPPRAAPPWAPSPRVTGSRSPGPTATRRSRRCSVPCRCSSTAAASTS